MKQKKTVLHNLEKIPEIKLSYTPNNDTQPSTKLKVNNSFDAFNLLYYHLYGRNNPQSEAKQQCVILFLTKRNYALQIRYHPKGSTTFSTQDVRDIVVHALQIRAHHVIMCRKDPDNRTPSKEDDKIIRRMRDLSYINDVGLLDYILISDKQYYSDQDWIHGKHHEYHI